MSSFVAGAGISLFIAACILLYFVMWSALKSSPDRRKRS